MLKRFPQFSSILPVYAVISFIVYNWAILRIFWKVQSWLYNLTFDEILGVSAYTFVTTLLDSIFVLGILLALCALLPSNWLKDDFAVRGVIISLCGLGSAMLHLYVNNNVDTFEQFINSMRLWWIVTFFVMMAFLWLSAKAKWLHALIINVSDRFIVFTYLFAPISILSIIIVIFRNIN